MKKLNSEQKYKCATQQVMIRITNDGKKIKNLP